MPIDEGLLIACKDDVVELTARVSSPERDSPEQLLEAAREVVSDHQYQAMTDPAILDPATLNVASCLLSRDPLPPAHASLLEQLGYTKEETESGGVGTRPLLGAAKRGARTQLDKWTLRFLRASDVDADLARWERQLIELLGADAFPDTSGASAEAFARTAESLPGLTLAPTRAALATLERTLLERFHARPGRIVLHPAMVTGLAAFLAVVLMGEAPESTWSDDPDDDAPLRVQWPGGRTIATDPEFRAVRFVMDPDDARLTEYVDDVLAQSRPENH